MINLESRLALADDTPEVHEFLATVGGELVGGEDPEGDDGVRWVALHPRSALEETFVARLTWTAYPHAPASITFTDGIRGVTGVVAAWPQAPGYRPPNDICMPFTAEGFALHPEWRTGPTAWSTQGNPFLWTVTQIQDDLDHRYQGRAG